MSENQKPQPAAWPLLLAPLFYFGMKYGVMGGNSMDSKTNIGLLLASVVILFMGRAISQRMQK